MGYGKSAPTGLKFLILSSNCHFSYQAEDRRIHFLLGSLNHGPIGEACLMWWKLLVGGILGLLVGHYVAPGYWLWVIIGLILGYLGQVWADRRVKLVKKEG